MRLNMQPRKGVDGSQLARVLRQQRAEFTSNGDGNGASALTNGRLHDALAAVLDLAMTVTRAHGGSVQLCDADGALRLIVHRGFSTEAAQFFRIIKEDKSSCHAALTRERRTVVPDVRRSTLFTEPARRVMLRSRLCACQSTPIRGHDGRLRGMLSTHFHVRHRPTTHQLRQMNVLARHAAALIEHRPQPVAVIDVNTIVDSYRSAHPEKTHTVHG